MVRAVKEALQRLRTYVSQNKSRITNIGSGNGTPGHRAAPSQTTKNDQAVGARLDFGEKVTIDGKDYRRYKFQINKQATDSTLKKLAAQDSHKVWAQADLPLNSPDQSEAVDQLFEDLETDLESRN